MSLEYNKTRLIWKKQITILCDYIRILVLCLLTLDSSCMCLCCTRKLCFLQGIPQICYELCIEKITVVFLITINTIMWKC